MDGRLHVTVAAHDDDLRRRGALAKLSENFEAVHPRHLDIEENEVVALVLDLVQRLRPRRAFGDVITLVFERHAEGFTDGLFVIHDENAGLDHVFLYSVEYRTRP